MQNDLRRAYDVFTALATHYGYVFAGVAMRAEPTGVYLLGNVTEKGRAFAELLRGMADLVEQSADAGKIVADNSTGLIN